MRVCQSRMHFLIFFYHNFGILEASAGNYEYDLWCERFHFGQVGILRKDNFESYTLNSWSCAPKFRRHSRANVCKCMPHRKVNQHWCETLEKLFFGDSKSSNYFGGIFSQGQFWVIHTQFVELCSQISQAFAWKRLQTHAASKGKPSLIWNFGKTIFDRLENIYFCDIFSQIQFWILHTQYVELRAQILQAFAFKRLQWQTISTGKHLLSWKFSKSHIE